MDKEVKEAAWGYSEKAEHRWPAAVAVLIAVSLYITLPNRFIVGPLWILPILETLLLIPLLLTSWRRTHKEQPWQRISSILLIAIMNLFNLISLVILIRALTHPKTNGINGDLLLLSATQIWFTNVIIFGLWYWELDRGGPAERCKKNHRYPDFIFPQMATPQVTHTNWVPNFLDYLYVSFTNATAFSPTDTLPLTRWAKILMMLQSFVSLVTVALVAARAVNILT